MTTFIYTTFSQNKKYLYINLTKKILEYKMELNQKKIPLLNIQDVDISFTHFYCIALNWARAYILEYVVFISYQTNKNKSKV